MQTEIDFTHLTENNPTSWKYYNENIVRFNKQCKHLFDLLMAGQELTRFSAMSDHKIMDLMRRKKDLTDKGIQLSSDKKRDGLMVVYMNEEQREFNRNFINQPT